MLQNNLSSSQAEINSNNINKLNNTTNLNKSTIKENNFNNTYIGFEKLQRKKKLISDKFAIIIFNNYKFFFKERNFTIEKIAVSIMEFISFENINNYNYNKLLKSLEEKVLEKVKPLKVVSGSKAYFKLDKDNDNDKDSTTLKDLNQTYNKENINNISNINININNIGKINKPKDKSFMNKTSNFANIGVWPWNRSFSSGKLIIYIIYFIYYISGDIFQAFKKDKECNDKLLLLKARQNDDWSRISNVIDNKFNEQKRQEVKTQKNKRIEMKHDILNQISYREGLGKIKMKEEKEKDLQYEIDLYNEYQQQEENKIKDMKQKQLKIKEDMDKVIIGN